MNNPNKPKNSTMKKYGIPAVMLAGGLALGAAFAPIGLAGAAEGDEGTDEGVTRESRRAEKAAVLEDLLGVTRDDLKAAFDEGQTPAEVAEANGVSQDELVAALVAQAEERIAEAVESGRLDTEQAAERTADLDERIEEKVTTVPSEREGRGGHGGRHARGAEALESLGLTAEDVRSGFEEGKTMAEIAADAGISEADLTAALVAAAEARIDAAVEADKIDADEAAEKKADLDTKISERINAEPGDRPERPGRPGRNGPRGPEASSEDGEV